MTEAKRLDRKTVFDGRVVHLAVDRVELPNGQTAELEVISHPGAAAMVPLSEDGEVLLVRQYRYATDSWLLEVPAGKLDPGEKPEVCAAREVEEEVGYRAGELIPLGWIWTTPGFTDEVIHLFAAFELEEVERRPEDDEVIELVRTPLATALELVWRGELNDAKSALALIHAAKRLGRLG